MCVYICLQTTQAALFYDQLRRKMLKNNICISCEMLHFCTILRKVNLKKLARITVFPLRVCQLCIRLILRACLLFCVLCKGNYCLFTRFNIKSIVCPSFFTTASGIIFNILCLYLYEKDKWFCWIKYIKRCRIYLCYRVFKLISKQSACLISVLKKTFFKVDSYDSRSKLYLPKFSYQWEGQLKRQCG